MIELNADSQHLDQVLENGVSLSNGHIKNMTKIKKYVVEGDQDESFSYNCIAVLKKLVQTSNVEENVATQLRTVIQKMEDRYKERGRERGGGGGESDKELYEYTPEEQWQIVASTIDRILFIVFLSIIILTTICCFGGTKYIT